MPSGADPAGHFGVDPVNPYKRRVRPGASQLHAIPPSLGESTERRMPANGRSQYAAASADEASNVVVRQLSGTQAVWGTRGMQQGASEPVESCQWRATAIFGHIFGEHGRTSTTSAICADERPFCTASRTSASGKRHAPASGVHRRGLAAMGTPDCVNANTPFLFLEWVPGVAANRPPTRGLARRSDCPRASRVHPTWANEKDMLV